MNLATVIVQLRQYCTLLGGRVGGAADFDTGVETVVSFNDPTTGALVYPIAVVIPLDDDAEDLDPLPGPQLNQMVHERVGIIVEFDASSDRRGQTAVDQVHAMKYALHSAILNWNPSPGQSVSGLRYAGCRVLHLDRARLFWQFDYTLPVQLTDGDGFPLSGDPLTDILASTVGLNPEITWDIPAV